MEIVTNEQKQAAKAKEILKNLHTPAFPPQIAQDNFGRIMAPIPGMTKLEFAMFKLLPSFLFRYVNDDYAISECYNTVLKLNQFIEDKNAEISNDQQISVIP